MSNLTIEEQITEVLVVVGGSWSVDEDAAEDAFPCLQSVVRMIPATAVLGCSPSVGHL